MNIKQFALLVGLIATHHLQPNNAASAVDVKGKMSDAKKLVKKAITYISDNSLTSAYDAFFEDLSWQKGELHVTILDATGTIIFDAHNEGVYTKINNFNRVKSTSKKGGGEIHILKNQSVFTVYVEPIKIDNEKYYVLSGFFSFADEPFILDIVNTIYEYFTENGLQKTIAQVNSLQESGKIIPQDKMHFPFICTMDGTCVAFKNHDFLVGKNIFDFTDPETNKPMIQTIQKVLTGETKEGKFGEGWIEYPFEHAHAHKKSYIKKLDENHFLGAGYYPEIDLDNVKSLVSKAISFIHSFGPDDAFKAFSDPQGNFIQGTSRILVWDTAGTQIINPISPELVGKNTMDLEDARGVKWVQEMIENVKKDETAVVNFVDTSSTWTYYAQAVETPDGKHYIIAAGYPPFNKETATHTLVHQAAKYFNANKPTEAFNTFLRDPRFSFGDLHLFIYDMHGFCFLNGPNLDFIWQNFINLEDQTGKLIISDLITETSLNDEAWLTFTVNNAKRRVFAEHVYESVEAKIEGQEFYRSYVIGSGYYL